MRVVTVRRTKDEPGTSTGLGRMSDERLDWHFHNWKTWMYSGYGVEGLPRSSAGLSSGGGQSSFDDLADASERRVAAVCNTLIDDLPPSQSAAIYNRYLHSVWLFPRGNQAECFEQGREAVREGFERRGIL